MKEKANSSSNRDDLAAENPIGDTIQILMAIVYVVIMILDAFIFKFSTFLSNYIPIFVYLPMGISFLLLAAYLGGISHQIVFKERRDPPIVINKSVFKFVRHPMYLGVILLYIGSFWLSLSLICLILIPFIIIIYDKFAKYEEKKLIEKFGDEYLKYKKEVGRWFPKLKKSK